MSIFVTLGPQEAEKSTKTECHMFFGTPCRTREIEPGEGCDLAMRFSTKYIETSPGMGHMIDELLVGIVMQCRRSEHRYIPEQSSIKQSIIGLFNSIIGSREDKRKHCRNLNM